MDINSIFSPAQPFRVNDYAPATGTQDLWADGKSKVVIISADLRPIKNTNDAFRLVLRIKCIEGENIGKETDYGLNIIHPSKPDNEKISRSQLSSLGHVTGIFVIDHPSKLFNIPFWVDVAGSYDAQDNTKRIGNEIKRVYDLHGNEPGKAGTGQQPAQMQPQQAPAQQPQPAPAAFGAPSPAAFGAPPPAPAAAPNAAFGAPPAQSGFGGAVSNGVASGSPFAAPAAPPSSGTWGRPG